MTAPAAETSPDRQPRTLDDALQFMKGVGPRIATAFERIGVVTAADLLRHIPRRWEDRTRFEPIGAAQPGRVALVRGRIVDVGMVVPKPRLKIVKALISDGSGNMALTWFNQPWLEKSLRDLHTSGTAVAAYGPVKRTGYITEMSAPQWEPLGESDPLSVNRIVPVYPSTEGLPQPTIRRIVDSVLATHGDLVEDFLPLGLRQKLGLIGAREAIRAIHFPENEGQQAAARRTLVFEEFFVLQAALAARRASRMTRERGVPLQFDAGVRDAMLRDVAPFELTRAQRRVIAEISQDLQSAHPMNRLLQGDVGSGKTMVAVAAILSTVLADHQAVLMAPTEILAQQHAIVMRRLLEPFGYPVELATGSLTPARRRKVLDNLRTGQSRIAVGTHAVLEDNVEFANLGLVIIDEQHRFGVLQRAALQAKGANPHVLVMTATPIPRTLTLTLYGDLDVSILDELPPGRTPIKTHWRSHARRGEVYSSAAGLIATGRQAYVVCPLVEESEALQARSATRFAAEIEREIYPQYRIGLLHGQLKSEQKADVMQQFAAHDIDVLVCTTVIEVGIDVPNATVVVIEDADRFGLAQLHQLRGRVGRGDHASYCILIADPTTEEGRRRMEVLVSTTDGFRIADADLELRGPGEFYGTRQSGIPELYIADVVADRDVMLEARDAAFAVVNQDPALSSAPNEPLRRAVAARVPGISLMSVS